MLEMSVESLPLALPDGVDYDEYLIGTYLASFPASVPIPRLAPALAIEQSTGTWVPVPGETPEVRCRHVAKVIGVYELPDFEFTVPPGVETRNYVIQIAFPQVNSGGIHAHPQGPVAGGKAFRQAIDATMKGIPLKEAAKQHPELTTALEAWTDPFGKGIAL